MVQDPSQEWQDPAPPAPPKQPLYNKWWFIALVAVVVLGIVAAAVIDSMSEDDAARTPTNSTAVSSAPPSSSVSEPTPTPSSAPTADPTPPAGGVLTDGGWTLESVQLSDNGLGNFGGTMRVVNSEGETRNGVFTLTLFLDGEVVGTAGGAVAQVEAGSTATVQLVSLDPYVEGDLTYDFQSEI